MSIITHDILPSSHAPRGPPPRTATRPGSSSWTSSARALTLVLITPAGDLTASLCQDVGGPTVVAVAVETTDPDRPVAEMHMSVASFRAFVELSQAVVLGVAEGGAR